MGSGNGWAERDKTPHDVDIRRHDRRLQVTLNLLPSFNRVRSVVTVTVEIHCSQRYLFMGPGPKPVMTAAAAAAGGEVLRARSRQPPNPGPERLITAAAGAAAAAAAPAGGGSHGPGAVHHATREASIIGPHPLVGRVPEAKARGGHPLESRLSESPESSSPERADSIMMGGCSSESAPWVLGRGCMTRPIHHDGCSMGRPRKHP
jgi:hypothetical protein